MSEYKVPAAAYWMLAYLYLGHRRFSELIEQFPKATVAKLLPDLEHYGYVKRSVSETRPLQVTYSITKKGSEFVTKRTDVELQQLVNLMMVLLKIKPDHVTATVKQMQEIVVKN